MLKNVRVLDLTWILGGPYAGQLLAQLGADVIKIEPPAGDPARNFPPVNHLGTSSFFLSVNRGKRAICLNLKSRNGYEVFKDLVRESDAVLYGFRPDVPAKLRIDFDTLRDIKPAICVGELIGFHDQDGFEHKAAYDLVVQALSGIMAITGHKDQPPVRVGYQIADLAGGLHLALGTIAAIVGAIKTGAGNKVQISLLDCQLSMLTWQAQNYLITGEDPKPSGSRHPMLAPSEVFKTLDDRYLAISPTGEHFWKNLCQAIGQPDLATDERFLSASRRIENVDELANRLAEVFRTRVTDDWLACLDHANVPAAAVLSVSEALNQPLAKFRHMVEPVEPWTEKDPLMMLGNPFKYAPSSEPLPYPPTIGQHSEEILRDICRYSDNKIASLIKSGDVIIT